MYILIFETVKFNGRVNYSIISVWVNQMVLYNAFLVAKYSNCGSYPDTWYEHFVASRDNSYYFEPAFYCLPEII